MGKEKKYCSGEGIERNIRTILRYSTQILHLPIKSKRKMHAYRFLLGDQLKTVNAYDKDNIISYKLSIFHFEISLKPTDRHKRNTSILNKVRT